MSGTTGCKCYILGLFIYYLKTLSLCGMHAQDAARSHYSLVIKKGTVCSRHCFPLLKRGITLSCFTGFHVPANFDWSSKSTWSPHVYSQSSVLHKLIIFTLISWVQSFYRLLTIKFFFGHSLTLHVDWFKKRFFTKKMQQDQLSRQSAWLQSGKSRGFDPSAGPILGFSVATGSEP